PGSRRLAAGILRREPRAPPADQDEVRSGQRLPVSPVDPAGVTLYAGFGRRGLPPMLGRNTVTSPIAGRNAQTLKTNSMLVWSARMPSAAAPIPLMPKAKPKNSPETMPIRDGSSAWPITTIAEKADEMTMPITEVSTMVQKRFA